MKLGADPNCDNGVGEPFWLSTDKPEIAVALLRSGANPSLVDDDGETALHRARLPAVIGELIQRGLDPDAKDHRGHTPLAAAVRYVTDASLGRVEALLAGGAQATQELLVLLDTGVAERKHGGKQLKVQAGAIRKRLQAALGPKKR